MGLGSCSGRDVGCVLLRLIELAPVLCADCDCNEVDLLSALTPCTAGGERVLDLFVRL